MRAWTYLLGVALLATVFLAAPAAGQIFVEPAEQEITVVAGGDPTRFTQNFTNPTTKSYFVLGTVTGNLTKETTLSPDRFQIGPDELRQVNVTIQMPFSAEFEGGTQTLVFTMVDRDTGDTFTERVIVDITVERKQLLLGVFENPLPATFQSGWGMFAAEIVAWIALSFAASYVLHLGLTWLLRKGREAVKSEMSHMMQAPLWYLIFVLGLNFSWRLVPPHPVVEVVARLNDAVAIFIAGLLAYRLVKAGLLYYAENVADRTRSQVDDVLVPVMQKMGATLIIVVAVLWSLSILGVDLSFLVAGGLVAGLVISFAAQDTLSNFFAGIFIMVDRPFREGDELMLETGEICRVERIGLRTTKLYHFQNHQQMILPNNDLATKRIINMSYPEQTYRIVIDVGVAYGSDLRKVLDVIERVVKEQPEVLQDETHAPSFFVREFGDSSINFQIRVFVPSSRRRNPVGSELRLAIKDAFDREGIEIPFPQRVLWYGKEEDEPTKPGASEPPSAEGPDDAATA